MYTSIRVQARIPSQLLDTLDLSHATNADPRSHTIIIVEGKRY